MLALKTDYFILTDFSKSGIPQSDVRQYDTDWPSGGGIKESVEFFRKEAEKGKVYIATQGTFGLMPFAFEIYLVQYPNITIEGFWPLDKVIPTKVIEKSKNIPTYFVFYQPCIDCKVIGEAPKEWSQLEFIYQYRKENGQRYLSIYRVTP